jgi:hypothetical protein
VAVGAFTKASLCTHTQEQERKSRVKGIEAVKASIHAAKAVSRILRSSLGPKGMDKMLQSPDGDVTISEWDSAEGDAPAGVGMEITTTPILNHTGSPVLLCSQ